MFSRQANGQGHQQDPNLQAHAGKKLDDAASRINWDEESTVQALTDEVSRSPHGFHFLGFYGIGPDKVPAPIADVLKERLAHWHVQHHFGKKNGITEAQVVKINNLLVDEFGLPPYTRTSAAQVRYLRLKLIAESPIFMGTGAIHSNMKIGESIGQEMSPLQGINLLLDVLGRKASDEQFQIAPERWDEFVRNRESERLAALSRQALAKNTKQEFALKASFNAKELDVRGMVVRHFMAMSTVEGLTLLDRVLAILEGPQQ